MAQTILLGRTGSPGVGTGTLLPIRPSANGSGETQQASVVDERERLLNALTRAATELETLASQLGARAGEEVGAIFEAQAVFARDPGIVDPALSLVDVGVAADEAILRATDEQAERLASVDDDYFRERAADVRDVGRRVAGLIRGETQPELWNRDGQPAILIAHDLDPSAVATLRRELVGGIALAGGAPTGHAAIVARALGIPLVLGLGAAIDDLSAGVDGAVDGSNGRLLISPSHDELAALASLARADSERAVVRGVNDRAPATPLDVAIAANIGSEFEAQAAAQAGADGVGLVRTELLFIGRHAPPTVAEQIAAYRRIRASMPGRPIVFRTLDVGGDKPAEWQHETEANPALGVRGVRLGLRRPSLFDDQLTALLEASVGDELRVMLPMVATREEFDEARTRLDAIVAGLVAAGRMTSANVKLGVMIEVPSAAVMADALAESAEFFSIGTNDLVQYTLAADRTNPSLAELAVASQPAILRLIDMVVRAAKAHGRHVAVCGEAAADSSIVPILVGLGVEELSVAPSSIGTIRALVSRLEPQACRQLASRALAASTAAEVRALAAGTATAASSEGVRP
jgi:phosphoenolpyruvate-protein phosphotransferase